MLKMLVIAVALAACGGKTGVYKNDYAGSITLTLVNATPRPIESVLIYPIGSSDQGSSWTEAVLGPGATGTIKIKPGNYELVATSAKRNIDEHTREVPKATTSLEIKSDQKLVFHDEGSAPAGLDAKGTLGVTFMISESDKKPDATEPTTEPAPDSPAPSP